MTGMADNALYPILFLDYFSTAVPALKDDVVVRFTSAACITAMLTFLNYLGRQRMKEKQPHLHLY